MFLKAPCSFLLFLLIGGLVFADDTNPSPRGKGPSPHTLCSYTFEAGLEGEIYPVFANYASLQRQHERSFAVVAVTVSNAGRETVRQKIEVQVPGWSDSEIQLAEIRPGTHRTLIFAPSFLPRFYENREIVAATTHVSITDEQGSSLYETTIPVRLRSGEDMYWGSDFKYAPFIASWVTPHDQQVEDMLTKAKQYTVGHRLPGYEDWKTPEEQELETYREAQAIFTAMQRSGFSYVKSSQTLGDHQNLSERIRLPHASLLRRSANCIDAAVTYASLFENLGMATEIILVPGHAYIGVRVASTSDKFLVIDAALTGRATFSEAVDSAERGLAREQGSVRPVLIEQARSSGIYPMPG